MAADHLKEVRSQYEDYPYPPRDPQEERTRLVETQGDFLDVVNYYCYGGRETFASGFRALVAGCGTGDAAIFLAEQLLESGGEVVALDFSERSLGVARARAEIRRLPNLRFVRAPIEEIPSLDIGHFDFINCSGVLHHLADPDAGLRILSQALKDAGALHLMVYAAHGRAPIYAMQALLRSVAGPELPPEERVRRARKLIDELPAENAFKKDFRRLGKDIVGHGDAGLFDLLLHAQDRAYTVPQLYALIEGAGLRLSTFDAYGGGGKTSYSPAAYLKDPGLLAAIAAKPAVEQHAIAELVAGNMAKHACYVTKRPVVPPSPDDPEAIPYIPAAWGEAGAHLDLQRRMLASMGGTMPVSLRGLDRLEMRVTPVAAALVGRIDGERSIGEVLASAKAALRSGGGTASDEFLAREFRALFDAFNALDWILLRQRGSRRMRSGAALQRGMSARM